MCLQGKNVMVRMFDALSNYIFTVVISFIVHWQQTDPHSGFKYQVQCAKNQVSVPQGLKSEVRPGASNQNPVDQPWGLLGTHQERRRPPSFLVATPSLTLSVFKLGKLML